MMFSYHPEKFFPYTQVDIVIYPNGKETDPDNFIEADPIKGPINQIINKTLDYLRTMIIRQKVAKVAGKAEAKRTYNYPYRAVEEAVVNALYHRSYQEREPVEISVMPDCIEIINYGGADWSIKLEDLRAGRRIFSRRYRNRRLGDFLKELDMTEGRGTGIPTIKTELQKNGSAEAYYESDEHRTYFYVRIPCHPDFICDELMIDEDGRVIDAKESKNHNPTRRQVFDAIKENPRISRRELSAKIGISPSAIQKHIEALIGDGYIERKGNTRGSYFLLVKE